MTLAAQILVLIGVIVQLFYGFWQDCHAREAKEPEGFGGIVITVLTSAFIFVVLWIAGTFSRILP